MSIRNTLVVVTGSVALAMATLAQAENPEQSSFSWDQEAQKNAIPAPRTAAERPDLHAKSDAQRLHKFSLRRIAPDEESFDPVHQMDPRIGRFQNEDAQN